MCKLKSSLRAAFSVLAIVLHCLFFSQASATVFIEQQLSFGTIAAIANGAPGQVVVTDNYHNTSGSLYQISPGHTAQLSLTNMMSNDSLSVTVLGQGQALRDLADNSLSPLILKQFSYPPRVYTDAQGNGFLSIGAVLEYGGVTPVRDSLYEATFSLTLEY